MKIKMKLDDEGIYKKISFRAYYIRGFVINQTIALERLIDIYIAKHFSNDEEKQHQLIQMILSTKRIDFEAKRQILKFIIENYDSNFQEQFPEIATHLKKIGEARNVFAHQILDTGKEALKNLEKGEIKFVNFHNTPQFISYNKNKIDQVNEWLKIYIKAFLVKNNQV